MKLAGQEERELAIARGSTCLGDPAITVILDGGWSKCAHKHSYNAKSQVTWSLKRIQKRDPGHMVFHLKICLPTKILVLAMQGDCVGVIYITVKLKKTQNNCNTKAVFLYRRSLTWVVLYLDTFTV